MIRQRPTLCKSRALYFRGCLTPLVRQPLQAFSNTYAPLPRLRQLYEAAMEPEIWGALMELRAFMFERVYSRDWAASECRKTKHIITELVGFYMEHPQQLPNEYLMIGFREGSQRAVCDYVACMTDAYAIKTYQKLFIPPFFDGIG